MPFLHREVKVREIGQMTVLEKDFVSDSHLPIFPNSRSWHQQRQLKVTRDSEKLLVIVRCELVGAHESSIDGVASIVLFEVEGGHGRTLWTRRRIIEDTRPSGVDPVNTPNVARGA